jgi:hypothetical protein
MLSVSFFCFLVLVFTLWYGVEFFSGHFYLEFEMPPVHGCVYRVGKFSAVSRFPLPLVSISFPSFPL